MNMTFHLTDACNLACTYCFQDRSPRNMTLQTALSAVDLSVKMAGSSLIPSGNQHTGICFFGGEPLLMRELIEEIIAYCEKIHNDSGHSFYYKLVTNGIFLDEKFLRFASDNHIGLGLSHDGLMQDDSRVFPDGNGTFSALERTIPILLLHLPKTLVMCTVNPYSVSRFSESVEWLFEKGFRRIYTVPAVGDKVFWNEDHMEILEEQYRRIGDLYVEWTCRGEEFEFVAFDTKISAHILGGMGKNQTCRFGQRQLSVAPDGKIYPCIQFLDAESYCMGNVSDGFDEFHVCRIVQDGKTEPIDCQGCVIKRRCKYNCCCMNKQLTGRTDRVSPFTCAHEQMLIRNADRVANELFRLKDSSFLERHYISRLGKMSPEFFLD